MDLQVRLDAAETIAIPIVKSISNQQFNEWARSFHAFVLRKVSLSDMDTLISFADPPSRYSTPHSYWVRRKWWNQHEISALRLSSNIKDCIWIKIETIVRRLQKISNVHPGVVIEKNEPRIEIRYLILAVLIIKLKHQASKVTNAVVDDVSPKKLCDKSPGQNRFDGYALRVNNNALTSEIWDSLRLILGVISFDFGRGTILHMHRNALYFLSLLICDGIDGKSNICHVFDDLVSDVRTVSKKDLDYIEICALEQWLKNVVSRNPRITDTDLVCRNTFPSITTSDTAMAENTPPRSGDNNRKAHTKPQENARNPLHCLKPSETSSYTVLRLSVSGSTGIVQEVTAKQTLHITNCVNSTIFIPNPVGDLLINNCENSCIIAAAVSSLVRVDGCRNMELSIYCRAIEVQSCSRIELYVSSYFSPVIHPSCHDIGLGPFNVVVDNHELRTRTASISEADRYAFAKPVIVSDDGFHEQVTYEISPKNFRVVDLKMSTSERLHLPKEYVEAWELKRSIQAGIYDNVIAKVHSLPPKEKAELVEKILESYGNWLTMKSRVFTLLTNDIDFYLL